MLVLIPRTDIYVNIDKIITVTRWTEKVTIYYSYGSTVSSIRTNAPIEDVVNAINHAFEHKHTRYRFT